jgi:uncharacterized protein (DUF362 family)
MQHSLFDLPASLGEVPTGHGNELLSISVLLSASAAEAVIEEFLEKSPRLQERIQSSRSVWIKPNVTAAENPGRGRTTQPIVLDGLLSVLQRRFPRKRLVVADSSVIGCDTSAAARVAGIFDVCVKRGVQFVDLRKVPFCEVVIPGHLEFASVHVSRPFTDKSTAKINLAKLKSTYGSPASFCLKNAKGCIPDEVKLKFHLRGLQRSLCDLGRAIEWDWCVAEAFPCSQLGEPGPSGLLISTPDIVVADLAACLALGLPLKDAFHVEWLSHYGGVDSASILSVVGFDAVESACQKLQYSRIAVADLEDRHRVKINDGRPCSACMESLAKALARIKNRSNEGVEIVLGADVESVRLEPVPGSGVQVFIGNCSFDRCAMEMEMRCYPDAVVDLWKDAVKVPGCPPTIDSMSTALVDAKPGATVQAPLMSKRIEEAFEIASLNAYATAGQMERVMRFVPAEAVTFDGLDRERRLAGEVICSAICHQMNWDFLRAAVEQLFAQGSSWWLPAQIAAVTPRKIEDLLQGYSKPERVRAKQRADMVRSLAALFRGGRDSYCDVFPEVLDGPDAGNDLLAALEGCQVFSEDHERKKLQVLLHRLAASGLVRGLDQLCQPAIDYHIMRLYIRRGEVVPTSSIGKEYIHGVRTRRAVTVTALRRTVSQALRVVSDCSGLPLHATNTIEWWIGRSVCTRTHPDCHLREEGSSWLRPHFDRCPFAGNCVAYNLNPELLQVTEPLHSGRFY